MLLVKAIFDYFNKKKKLSYDNFHKNSLRMAMSARRIATAYSFVTA